MIEHEFVDTWLLLNTLFTADSPISRSQYYDAVKSNKLHIPEIRLWVDVLKLVIIDWKEYAEKPTPENYKLVKDVEEWAFRESLSLSLIADSIFLAFQIEPEIFKRKFRAWLMSLKPVEKPAISYYELSEPLQSIEIISYFMYDITEGIE